MTRARGLGSPLSFRQSFPILGSDRMALPWAPYLAYLIGRAFIDITDYLPQLLSNTSNVTLQPGQIHHTLSSTEY